MMLAIGVGSLLKIGGFLVDVVVTIIGAVRGKPRKSLPEVDVHVTEPPHPRFTDVEHMRQQERASIAASKALTFCWSCGAPAHRGDHNEGCKAEREEP
jgi:predicted NAD/FAD-binding protein